MLGHRTTREPDLHVIAAGRELGPEDCGRLHRFRIPSEACAIRLVSRSAVPAEIHDDGIDHRRLGIALSRVVYDGLLIPLSDPRFSSGWHELERGDDDVSWRWTNGDAGLVLVGGGILEIEVAMTLCYWIEQDEAQTRTA